MSVIVLPPPSKSPLVTAYLDARLALVEAVIERLADPASAARMTDPRPAIEHARDAAIAAGVELPDAQLAHHAGLSAGELDLLWLIAAPAIDPAIVTLLRRIDGVGREIIDASVAARALAPTRLDRQRVLAALEPDAPLRRHALVRVAGSDRAAGRELTAASWIPGALRGLRALGVRLEGAATLVTPSIGSADVPLPDRAGELAAVLAGGLAERGPGTALFGGGGLDHPRGVAVYLQGNPGSGRGVLVRAIAGQLGRRLLVVDGARVRHLPAAVLADVLDAACGEAAAFGELLVVRNAAELALPGAAAAPALARALAAHRVVAVLVVNDDAALAAEVDQLIVFRHQHEIRPQTVDAAHLWLLNLPPTTELDSGLELDAFARSLHLTPVQIRAAARAAVLTAGPRPLGAAQLDSAARAQLTQGIGRLAEVQPATVTLADLVLPDEQRHQIEDVISAARNRDLVLRRWGLRRTIKRGLSITCLFDGTPGTGKTLAGEVIACELGLQMLRINVASIVDKYIGETEKNLTRIFEQARPDTTLLLFDEADSLFTKRTEVTHANDRFSNMNVNVLLQLIERFEGTAILTTNLKKGLDTAFERRITFKVHFERPDAEQRRRIWKLMLPPSVPTAEPIDYERLARLDLSGGEIKNAVLRAAYAAARERSELRMRHLTAAAAAEAASTGRVYFDTSPSA